MSENQDLRMVRDSIQIYEKESIQSSFETNFQDPSWFSVAFLNSIERSRRRMKKKKEQANFEMKK